MSIDRPAVESFLYREARLMDESRYKEWLDLFTEDALYWIPSNEDDADPSRHVSIVYAPKPQLEAHLFDFSGDLYGKTLAVELLAFIRPERKFENLDALKAQIAQDGTRARGILAAYES